ncbi:MAG: glycosyltransferase family 1 protein [Aquificae bacterium]|nr:glycosyltransferase family 1 protein [Aquificota bacterium]
MKPRVVFIKTPDPVGFTDYIIDGLSKAVSSKDFETKVLEANESNLQQIAQEIIDFKPLFTFDINLNGVLFAEKDNVRKPFFDILGNIHISWFIEDPMVHFSKLKSVLNSNQILFLTVDVEHSQWLAGMRKNVAYMLPGINPSYFKPPLWEREFDVTFVGPIIDPVIFEQQWKNQMDETLYFFSIELGRLLYRNPDMPIRFGANYIASQFNPKIQEVLFKFQKEKDDEYINLLIQVGSYAMNLRRWKILESIEDTEVHILGKVEGETSDNVIVYPDINNITDIIRFLEKTKIALLSQPTFLPTSFGFTVFNSVASGALTMVEDRFAARTILYEDREIITYHPLDPVEIEGKLAYYLHDAPHEREEIAKAGRERVLKEHTLLSRGEFLTNMMKDIINKVSQEQKEQNN